VPSFEVRGRLAGPTFFQARPLRRFSDKVVELFDLHIFPLLAK
jgi:hypothetical protein